MSTSMKKLALLGARCHPLRLRGHALPAALVLVARLLVLTLLVLKDLPFARHLPYWLWLDELGSAAQFHSVLLRVIAVAYALILFSPLVRTGCALAGATYLLSLLACRPCLSVAHTYVGCLFVMLALSSQFAGARLVRWQLIVLYAGAAANKLLDVDWWNGRYFDTLLADRHQLASYAKLAAFLPPLALAQFLGISTILIQLVLVVCFARRRWQRWGIWLGAVFHSVMVLWLNQTFGPFYLAILFSYLAFVTWPETIEVSAAHSRWADWLARGLSWLDFDQVYRFNLGPAAEAKPALAVTVNHVRQSGVVAALLLLFFQPLVYAVIVVVLAHYRFAGAWRSVTILLLLLALTVLLSTPSRVAALLPTQRSASPKWLAKSG